MEELSNHFRLDLRMVFGATHGVALKAKDRMSVK